MMKKAGVFAASLAAASSAALTAANPDHRASDSRPCSEAESGSSRKADAAVGTGPRGGAEGKFAPRFDGLRFIETLVTAHR